MIINILNVEKGIVMKTGPPGTGKTKIIIGLIQAYKILQTDCRILVCASSNGAVDEIACKFIDEFTFDNGVEMKKLKVLRFGGKQISNKTGITDLSEPDVEVTLKVEPISFDYKLQMKLKKLGFDEDPIEKINFKREKLKRLRNPGGKILDKETSRAIKKTQRKFNDLKEKRIEYLRAKKRCKDEILSKTKIMFCTSNAAGSKIFMENDLYFDYLIIDEACQASEPSTLIPFQYNTKTAVLIGDKNQLPATIFAEISRHNGYNTSLFERLSVCNPEILTTQYRMHPDISQYISSQFYKRRLINADSVLTRKNPDLFLINGVLYTNLKTSKEIQNSNNSGFRNEKETEFIVNYCKEIDITSIDYSIGIIAPYKHQVDHLKAEFDSLWGAK